ncbi:MAG: hypothetical protein M3O99_05145 [Chloroflexota bacterium]|nr:hypothetical protein [Chloroflexota bacterium]
MTSRTALYLVVLLLLGACAPRSESHGCDGPAGDHVMFIDRLRCNAIQVDIGEAVTLPVLRPPGTTLLLSGGGLSSQAEVQSFNYDDTDLGADGRGVSEADARKFAPDGSLIDRSQSIYYRGTPHLFRRDRVLVIYAGDDRALVTVLTKLLGNQFAGG